MAGIAASVPFVSQMEWWPLWLAACFLVGISFLEDIIGLPITGRLVVHFLTAGGAAAGLTDHVVWKPVNGRRSRFR